MWLYPNLSISLLLELRFFLFNLLFAITGNVNIYAPPSSWAHGEISLGHRTRSRIAGLLNIRSWTLLDFAKLPPKGVVPVLFLPVTCVCSHFLIFLVLSLTVWYVWNHILSTYLSTYFLSLLLYLGTSRSGTILEVFPFSALVTV